MLASKFMVSEYLDPGSLRVWTVASVTSPRGTGGCECARTRAHVCVCGGGFLWYVLSEGVCVHYVWVCMCARMCEREWLSVLVYGWERVCVNVCDSIVSVYV